MHTFADVDPQLFSVSRGVHPPTAMVQPFASLPFVPSLTLPSLVYLTLSSRLPLAHFDSPVASPSSRQSFVPLE